MIIKELKMTGSELRKEIFKLIERRAYLEQKVLEQRHKMTRGSVFEVYTKCRKGGCKCTKGEAHGPFMYMNVIIKGKNIQKYVEKKEDQGLLKRLKQYKVFQGNLTELNQLNKKVHALFRNYRKELVEEIDIVEKEQ